MSANSIPGSQSNLFSVLRHRNFALLWLGQGISQIGDGVFNIAMMWLVLQLTGSAFAMATLAILAMVPRLAFQLVGGVWVDRYDRRVMMLLSDAIRSAIVLTLGILIATDQVQLGHLYVLNIAFGIVGAFFYPAQGALVPNLVPKDELIRANSLSGLTQQLAAILGPALGGVLVAIPAIGIAGVCFLNAISFGIGVVGLMLMQIPARENSGSTKHSMWGELKAGMNYLWGFRALVIILFVSMILNFALGPFPVIMPIFAKTILGLGADGLGILMSAFSAGSLVGSLVIGAWSPKQQRGLIAFSFIAIVGVFFSALGLVPIFAAVLVMLAISGGLLAIVNTIIGTMIQTMIADEYRGRVLSINTLIATGLMPLALAIGGVLADALGVTTVFVVSGMMTTVVSLASFVSRDIRELQ